MHTFMTMLMGSYEDLGGSVITSRLLKTRLTSKTISPRFTTIHGFFSTKRESLICGTTHLYKKVKERNSFCTMAKHKLYKSQPKICWRGRKPDLSFVWQFLIQSIIVILKII